VHHQTVQRCVERAESYGPLSALDDRPRPGKEPVITPEAKAWLVSLACDKAKDHGYPHELWTTRLLARHAREHGPGAGHPCLARLVQGTVSKLLGQEEIKPHKMRYYLERRDAEFEQTLTFFRLPRTHHKHLKSTNMLERLNEEIRRRTYVVRIFPNTESCLRLVRALAVETHENWMEANRYINMDDLREHKKLALRNAA
jgi:hypothetical protein